MFVTTKETSRRGEEEEKKDKEGNTMQSNLFFLLAIPMPLFSLVLSFRRRRGVVEEQY